MLTPAVNKPEVHPLRPLPGSPPKPDHSGMDTPWTPPPQSMWKNLSQSFRNHLCKTPHYRSILSHMQWLGGDLGHTLPKELQPKKGIVPRYFVWDNQQNPPHSVFPHPRWWRQMNATAGGCWTVSVWNTRQPRGRGPQIRCRLGRTVGSGKTSWFPKRYMLSFMTSFRSVHSSWNSTSQRCAQLDSSAPK